MWCDSKRYWYHHYVPAGRRPILHLQSFHYAEITTSTPRASDLTVLFHYDEILIRNIRWYPTNVILCLIMCWGSVLLLTNNWVRPNFIKLYNSHSQCSWQHAYHIFGLPIVVVSIQNFTNSLVDSMPTPSSHTSLMGDRQKIKSGGRRLN